MRVGGGLGEGEMRIRETGDEYVWEMGKLLKTDSASAFLTFETRKRLHYQVQTVTHHRLGVANVHPNITY